MNSHVRNLNDVKLGMNRWVKTPFIYIDDRITYIVCDSNFIIVFTGYSLLLCTTIKRLKYNANLHETTYLKGMRWQPV